MGKLFSISVDMSALHAVNATISAGILQNLSSAVQRVTEYGAEQWRDAVSRAPLRETERTAYIASINWKMVSDYAGEIVSDYKFVEDIETGRPAYDMKRALDTSMKVRVSKKGRRYLIIPIRSNTPGNISLARAMPQHVYKQAKALEASKILSIGRRVSGTGAYHIGSRTPWTVKQNKYAWGAKLPAGLVPKLKPHHATDPYAGMYRFTADNPSGGQYSTYISFRVMAEGQTGWILPAKPGLFLAQKVATDLQPLAEQMFARAVATDTGSA